MTENADGRGCWACQQIKVAAAFWNHLASSYFFPFTAVLATPLGGPLLVTSCSVFAFLLGPSLCCTISLALHFLGEPLAFVSSPARHQVLGWSYWGPVAGMYLGLTPGVYWPGTALKGKGSPFLPLFGFSIGAGREESPDLLLFPSASSLASKSLSSPSASLSRSMF